MIDLNDIAIFAKVAQLQSFSRAAHALAMPVSTVSRRVSALEEQLGVTLLQRTTRRLSLTAQGRAYLDQCDEPLKSLYDAQKVLTKAQKQPEGPFDIAAEHVEAEHVEGEVRHVSVLHGVRGGQWPKRELADNAVRVRHFQ